MMRNTAWLVAPMVALLACSGNTPTNVPDAQQERVATGRGAAGVVYVTSQALYYDTYGTADALPPHGPFQQLINGTTEFGPGQPGYLGGRWWVDTNNNNMQDPTDTYFSCPLLGPGRTTP
jgi:hypothetical protein